MADEERKPADRGILGESADPLEKMPLPGWMAKKSLPSAPISNLTAGSRVARIDFARTKISRFIGSYVLGLGFTLTEDQKNILSPATLAMIDVIRAVRDRQGS